MLGVISNTSNNDETWIGAMNYRKKVLGKPRFKHELRSKYEAVKNSEDTTTNSREAVKLTVPHKASMYSIILQFKTEESLVRLKIRDAAIGANSEKGKKRSLDRDALRDELRQLVCNYQNIPLQEYTNYVLAFYNTNI